MPKKIILTEQQFNKLQQFIVETKFEDFISKNAKVNDIIRIEFKNSVNNFKVILNDSGQITMDNIDAGSANINYRYFFSKANLNLNGNKLEIRKVHKTKEADKLKDIKSWKPETINDIKNIELIRNGKVVDKVDDLKVAGVSVKNKIDIDSVTKKTLNLFSTEIKEGNGVLMKMDNNENLLFCCIGRTNNSVTLELTSNTKIMSLKNYGLIIIEINKENDSEEGSDNVNNNIITSENGTSFSLKAIGVKGEDKKNIVINGILDISATVSCDDSTEEKPEENKDDNSDGNSDDKEKLKADAKKAMEMILKDETLKKAFYSQPSLWDLFVAELTGKKATGKGIVPVLDIINSYDNKKETENLNAEFITGRTVFIQFLEDIFIPNTIEIRASDNKTRKTTVAKKELGEKRKLTGIFENGKIRYEIELLEQVEDKKDVFLSKIKLKVDNNGDWTDVKYENKIEIKVIKGSESPGYNPIDKNK
jgi:hypothetical protein